MDIETLAHAPNATEIALFEELIDWIDDETDLEPVRQTIRARRASFDVFRSYHDTATRDELLSTMPFADEIRRASERHGIDALLIAAIVEVESSFDPCVVSHQGATGLMQVMPATAGIFDYDRLTDPGLNIELGTSYLRHLLALYHGDLELALAAYNAGPANVRRYDGVPPFHETQRYVEKVLGAYVGHHQEVWRSNETSQTLGLVG